MSCPVSSSSKGPPDTGPYVPEWCYPNGPQVCPCGHHEGYHGDSGQCSQRSRCGCPGIPPECVTPDDELGP